MMMACRGGRLADGVAVADGVTVADGAETVMISLYFKGFYRCNRCYRAFFSTSINNRLT
jgi:hypothetical protein